MPLKRYRVRRRVLPAIATAASIVLIGAAHSAPAQAPEAPPPAAWRVECSGDGKVLGWRAVQQAVQRENRQLGLSLAVRPAPDGKTGAMLITLLLGLNLTEPVQVKVDNGISDKQAIQTCTNVGCFVA